MTDQSEQTGQCLCGKVRFSIAEPEREVGICHCNMCRRWSGGPLLAVHIKGRISFDGEENIATWQSSQWAERAFCKTCGSNLYYRLRESGDYIITAGLLDDQSGLNLTNQIFIDEKPEFYDFANDTNKMTGAEVFAQYAPKDGGA